MGEARPSSNPYINTTTLIANSEEVTQINLLSGSGRTKIALMHNPIDPMN